MNERQRIAHRIWNRHYRKAEAAKRAGDHAELVACLRRCRDISTTECGGAYGWIQEVLSCAIDGAMVTTPTGAAWWRRMEAERKAELEASPFGQFLKTFHADYCAD